MSESPAVDPLVALIRSQPGMAERLLAEHADDGRGRCRVCSAGGQTGRFRWPCTLHRSAHDSYNPVRPTDVEGPSSWFGSFASGRDDLGRNHDDLLAEGFGRS